MGKVDHANDKAFDTNLEITKKWIDYVKHGGVIPNEKIDDLGNALYALIRDKNTSNATLTILNF